MIKGPMQYLVIYRFVIEEKNGTEIELEIMVIQCLISVVPKT